MIQHHRRELIEQSFVQAERDVDSLILVGPRWARVFGQASKAVGQNAQFKEGFDFQDYSAAGFPDTAAEWAMKHGERVQQDPVQAMSEWIDSFPRARQAVDRYCAAQAKQDLSMVAQSARPGDLASPDDALARRSRGLCM